MCEVEDNSVKLIIASPPEVYPTSNVKLDDDNNVLLNFLDALSYYGIRNIVKECYRVLKPEGTFFWNVGVMCSDFSEVFGEKKVNCLLPYESIRTILMSAPFHPIMDFIMTRWSAGMAMPQLYGIHKMFGINYEHFFMFSKTGLWKKKINPTPIFGNSYPAAIIVKGYDEMALSNLLSKDATKSPTQFCSEMIQLFIHAFSDEGDLLLDPLAGSGTLGKIANQMNRNCILYEIKEELREKIKSVVGPSLIEGN